MSQSFRVLKRGLKGRVRENFNLPAGPRFQSHHLVYHITAAEVKPREGGSQQIDQNFIYWLGEANVWVSNVSPHFQDHFVGEPSGVEFVLNVDWDSPLDVAYTVTVEDQPVAETQGY